MNFKNEVVLADPGSGTLAATHSLSTENNHCVDWYS